MVRNSSRAVDSGRKTSSGRPIYVSASQKAREDSGRTKTSSSGGGGGSSSSNKSLDISPALSPEAQARQAQLQTGKGISVQPKTLQTSTPTRQSGSASSSPLFDMIKDRELIGVDTTKQKRVVNTSSSQSTKKGVFETIKDKEVISITPKKEYVKSSQPVLNKIKGKEVVSVPKDYYVSNPDPKRELTTKQKASVIGSTVKREIKKELKSPFTQASLAFAVAEPTILGETAVGAYVAGRAGLTTLKVLTGGSKLVKTVGLGSAAVNVAIPTAQKTAEVSAPYDVRQELINTPLSQRYDVYEEMRNRLYAPTEDKKISDTKVPKIQLFGYGTSGQRTIKQTVMGFDLASPFVSSSKIKEQAYDYYLKQGLSPKEAETKAEAIRITASTERKTRAPAAIFSEIMGNRAKLGIMSADAAFTPVIKTTGKKFVAKDVGFTAVSSFGEAAPSIAAQEKLTGKEFSGGQKAITYALGVATSSGTSAVIDIGIVKRSPLIKGTGSTFGNVLDPNELPGDIFDTILRKTTKSSEPSLTVTGKKPIVTVFTSEEAAKKSISNQKPTVLTNDFTKLITGQKTSSKTDEQRGRRKTPPSSISTQAGIIDNTVTEITNENKITEPIKDTVRENTPETTPEVIKEQTPTTTPIDSFTRTPLIISRGELLPPIPLGTMQKGGGGRSGSKKGRDTFANELAIAFKKLGINTTPIPSPTKRSTMQKSNTKKKNTKDELKKNRRSIFPKLRLRL